MDVRLVNVPHLRAHIGMVMQDAALFDCSIGDNIAYGLRAAALPHFCADDHMPAIIEAAKTANIHDFIVGLPQVQSCIPAAG